MLKEIRFVNLNHQTCMIFKQTFDDLMPDYGGKRKPTPTSQRFPKGPSLHNNFSNFQP